MRSRERSSRTKGRVSIPFFVSFRIGFGNREDIEVFFKDQFISGQIDVLGVTRTRSRCRFGSDDS
jgi:hypothetical protein